MTAGNSVDGLMVLCQMLPPPVIALCAVYIAKAVRDAKESIQQLNIKMAVIIERVDSHEKRITHLEK